jgi:molecular chaperone GrpE
MHNPDQEPQMTNEHDSPCRNANPPEDANPSEMMGAAADPEAVEAAGADPPPTPEAPMTPAAEASMLRAALAEANEKIARQADAVQRGQADLANLRRRHDEERVSIREQANSRLLVQLLPIVDELDLAVNHLGNGGDEPPQEVVNQSWTDGVRLIQRKLAAFLESQGVTRIDSLGEPFNPELHEAVGIAQVRTAESGCIVEVLRQGYRLHNRVVQAAQVVVNQ